MDVEVDHYVVLGLPSGQEGSKLSSDDIKKAYRAKALELHPDKRPHDPNALDNFQKLKTSYQILKDEKARLVDSRRKERDEEERIAKKVREEIARIRAMHANNL